MDEEGGTLSRLLGDPVRVRRPASVAGFILAALSGVSYLLLGEGLLALLYGLTWLALPFAAGILGYGRAFFIEYGMGVRRALLEAILGLLAAIVSCVVLAGVDLDGSSTGARALAAAPAGLLYLGLFRALASGIALGLGRGLGYAGRRIQELDDEGW